MSVGDERILPNGKIEKVISETLISNYCQETKEQEKERIKKGLPAPMYAYTAVKTEELDAGRVKGSPAERMQKEAKYLLNMPYQERQTYYKNIAKTTGEQAVHALIAEVKKQRSLSKSKDKAIAL
jgi:hypothetical protein